MSQQQPLVSIIMPAYNAEAYVGAAIESIMGQSYTNWELIVINDGSGDATLEIIKGYAQQDQRIRVIHQVENQGLVKTRNRGLDEAQGHYIANLDSDDVSHAERLADQVAFLEANSNYVLIGSACDIIDAEGKQTGAVDRDIPDAHIHVLLLFSNYLINSTVMFRAAAVKELGYATNIAIAEDYALFVALSKRGDLGNLKQSRVGYRVHGSNISKRKEAAMYAAIHDIQQRQLQGLNIEATADQLRLHQSLVDGAAVSLGFDLATIERWLLGIIAANESRAIYPPEILGHYCAFFYRRACESSGLGAKAIRLFRASTLSSHLHKDLKGNFAFMFRSLTKRNYVE